MTPTRPHIPALDGLRGIAVLLVFASHARVPGFSLGGVAVDMFFVLSGFLITGILIDEIGRTDGIVLSRFFVRRIRRLVPALFVLALLYALIAPMVWKDRTAAEHAGLSALSFFYLMDYARVLWVDHNPLTHTWSLAVEEHFYLVWPFALLGMSRWVPVKHWIEVLAAAYLAATVWRCISIDLHGWTAVYFRFDTRLSALILGSLLAVLFKLQVAERRREAWLLALILGALAITGAACWIYDGAPTTGGWATLGLAIAEGVAALLILTVVQSFRAGTSSLLARALSIRPLTYAGRISYGLYLYHYPLTYWLVDHPWGVALSISFPVALLLAAASYQFIEQPVLRGSFFSRPAPAPGAVPPEALGVPATIASASLSSGDPLSPLRGAKSR